MLMLARSVVVRGMLGTKYSGVVASGYRLRVAFVPVD